MLHHQNSINVLPSSPLPPDPCAGMLSRLRLYSLVTLCADAAVAAPECVQYSEQGIKAVGVPKLLNKAFTHLLCPVWQTKVSMHLMCPTH